MQQALVWAQALQLQQLAVEYLGEQTDRGCKAVPFWDQYTQFLEYFGHIEAGSCKLKATVAQLRKQIPLLCTVNCLRS